MPDLPDQATRDEMEKMLGAPILFPPEFKNWLSDFVATNIPLIPFSHIFGAKLNVARSGDYIATPETGPGASYGDCATVGPQVTNLSDGTYLIVYGAASRGRTSISINGATATDDDSMYGVESGPPCARAKIMSLSNHNSNTVCLKYKGSDTFKNRWLTVTRLGAP